MKRKNRNDFDDDEEVELWSFDALGQRRYPERPSYRREFKLAPHHRLAYGKSPNLVPDSVDPMRRQGLPVLTSPDGRPVARLHGDLKPGEVSWVLR